MSDLEINDDIDPLTRLAVKHGTDKWGPHFYTPLYHELFSRLRDRPIRLLEIGIGGYDFKTVGGASLAMWADYFTNGQVTGIDISEKRLTLNPRIKLLQGSQNDPAFLKYVCDERVPFDIIIDDGSHNPKDVVASFQTLFPFLADGGSYLIEDMQTTFWPLHGGSISRDGATMKLARTIVECLNHAEISIVDRSYSFPPFVRQIKALRAFHNVLVIDKGDNSEPSNFDYDFNNPYASKAARIIEQELARAPTAEGMAGLINLYVTGGDLVKAKEIADRAVSRWPANSAVLAAAYGVARQQKDPSAKIQYLERILQIEPDNAALQRELVKTRAQRK
jgi:tetratricopeptide (TPR) repeat protein